MMNDAETIIESYTQKIKALEQENARLKQEVSDLEFEVMILNETIEELELERD